MSQKEPAVRVNPIVPNRWKSYRAHTFPIYLTRLLNKSLFIPKVLRGKFFINLNKISQTAWIAFV